jgi:PGF-CTERM protein
MRHARHVSGVGIFCCVLALLVLGALSFGPPAAGATASESGENVSVYRASNASFESAEAIETAIASGSVHPAENVTFEDTLVVRIESERLTDSMNATNGSTTTRFFTALDGDAEFRIIQTNPRPQSNRKLATVGPENATVHRNETTVYLQTEADELSFRYRRVGRETELYGGERFAVQFGYDLPDTWSRATEPSDPIIEFHPRSELTTDQPSTTTTETPTAMTSETTTATTADTPTSERSITDRTTTQETSANRTGTARTGPFGVPGFGVPATVVALLVLAVLGTRRS